MSHVRPLAASLVALALLGAAAPLPAAAQLVEAKVLGRAAAGQALAAAEAEARRNGWNVSIAVVDGAGSLVAFLRMDDASPASVDLSQGKARTAARFRRPSKALEETIAGGRVAFTAVEGKVPQGMIFVPYGPPTCQLMGQYTDGTGMPTSKGWEVEVEPLG